MAVGSTLGLRITIAVFVTIMIVQAIVTMVTVKIFENNRYMELRSLAASAIVALMHDNDQGIIENSDEFYNLIKNTQIEGVTIYRADQSHLISFGLPSSLLPGFGAFDEINPQLQTYETLFLPNELNNTAYAAVRLNSMQLIGEIKEFILIQLIITILFSLLVTQVLVMALNHWLLTPLSLLQKNIIRAVKNPENPHIERYTGKSQSEIIQALYAAENLIKQNSRNIRRIKTAAESRIHRLAYYDSLTELPNRLSFIQALKERATKTEENKSIRFGVMVMDLDHFKDINDTVGHFVGDQILKAFARRIVTSLPETAVVARSGEDEFAVMIPLEDNQTNFLQMAENLSEAVKTRPFKIMDEEFTIRISIGLATYPDDADDPDQVIKNADIALNRAKDDGRDNIRVFSSEFHESVQQRFQILRDLRQAMDKNELELHYQPQIDLASGQVMGAEALLRWWKPDEDAVGMNASGKFISPADFIPIAEHSGLILPIGEWVMRTACRACSSWRSQGHENVHVAVNVSAAQFQQQDLPSIVRDVLSETNLPAELLELEVTESLFMDDVEHTIQTLRELNDIGVLLAIDDFGTGYSSLSYLRQFPIDRLKIDASFIRDILTNQDDASIARTIIGLGKTLNLEVIAEGVETSDQQSFLIKEGCQIAQGFFYSKPVSLQNFLNYLAQRKIA